MFNWDENLRVKREVSFQQKMSDHMKPIRIYACFREKDYYATICAGFPQPSSFGWRYLLLLSLDV